MHNACSLTDMRHCAPSGPVTAIPLAYMVIVINVTFISLGMKQSLFVLQTFLDGMEHEVKTNPNFKGQLGHSKA